MMGKELCFCVEKKNLYLEQVLVDYMEIPIFFLCKNDGQYYVALCTDMDALNYIIVEASASDVYNLLHGKIPMRNAILAKREYWEVISGEEIPLDTVRKHQISHLDCSLLPEENACFEILTGEMEAYVREFDRAFFDVGHFRKIESKVALEEIFIEGMLDAEIENFISLGDYSIKFKLTKQSAFVVDLRGEYMNPVKKKAVLQQSNESGKWEYDDTLNVAA